MNIESMNPLILTPVAMQVVMTMVELEIEDQSVPWISHPKWTLEVLDYLSSGPGTAIRTAAGP